MAATRSGTRRQIQKLPNAMIMLKVIFLSSPIQSEVTCDDEGVRRRDHQTAYDGRRAAMCANLFPFSRASLTRRAACLSSFGSARRFAPFDSFSFRYTQPLARRRSRVIRVRSSLLSGGKEERRGEERRREEEHYNTNGGNCVLSSSSAAAVVAASGSFCGWVRSFAVGVRPRPRPCVRPLILSKRASKAG